MSVLVFLKFTLAQAKVAARVFNGRADDDPEGDRFDADGWFRPDPDGPRYYYNFDYLGRVRSTNPTGLDANGEPTYTLRAGQHVNLLWQGPEEALPAKILPFRVFPVHPAVIFG